MGWRTEMYQALDERLANLAGGKTAAGLAKLGLNNVGDLLRHLPRRYIVGTEMSSFDTLVVGDDVALVARVRSSTHHYGRAKQRINVVLTDGRGQRITAAFFADKNYLIEYWKRVLAPGVRGIFIGKISEFNQDLQLAHPDFVILDDNNRIVAGRVGEREAIYRTTQRDSLVGIYPSVQGVPTWVIAETAALALPQVEGLAEPYPDWLLDAANLVRLDHAFRAIHTPQTLAEADTGCNRLKFDEAFAAQVSLAYRRAERARTHAEPIVPKLDGVLAAFDARLPFELTAGQDQVSAEIFEDLARPTPMNRLLQGEVGSGKTAVALRAMLAVVDAGGQAALLAPTEVLARQHHRSILALLGDLSFAFANPGCHVVLHTGQRAGTARAETLAAIATGEANIVVGTHALLGSDVEFARLSLVVVDEQHRFGVEQRSALSSRSETPPHTLVMTATPIPRSVAMTVFGDLSVSELRELPKGRADVQTVFVNTARQPTWVERAWERAREEVAKGRQVFIVCPRIDSDDAEPGDGLEEMALGRSLAGVLATAEQLAAGALASLRLGVVHGRQSANERDETMQAFVAGQLDVLVATTVIEVGIDVPNASMMVILDADRFGLAQLHQLRGRIGRAGHAGLCLLLAPVLDHNSVAAQRLQAMVDSRDGFALAETDLVLRREGDVLGAEQSGKSSLKLLRVLADKDLILKAKELAERVVADDPGAEAPWVADLLRQVSLATDWAEKA